MKREEIITGNPLVPWLEARGVKITENGRRAARCPLKEHTRQDNVSLDAAKGVWHCHACGKGGTAIDWLALEKGITIADAMRELGGNGNKATPATPRREVAGYNYTDENGVLLFQVIRFEPKDFCQRRPDGKGGWIWSLSKGWFEKNGNGWRKIKGAENRAQQPTPGAQWFDEVRRVLFRLLETIRAVQRGLPVFVCEGEKDALAMAEHNFAATCNPGGAGKWRDEYSETLRGAPVVVIADKDKKGREHAAQVARSLHGKAKSVRVVELPNTNGLPVKDAADYFAAGGEADKLLEVADAAPEYHPPTEPPQITALDSPEDVTTWIRGEIVAALTNGNLDAYQRRQQIAANVVSALAKIGRFYYRETRRDFDSALFFNLTTKRLERIASDSFGAWLSDWLRVNRAENIFKSIFAAVQTAALAGPLTRGIEPENFWASRPGALYLSNGDGQLVKITAQAVTLADNGSDDVLFAADKALAPWKLTTPRAAFTVCRLFADANCTAPHGKLLLQLWAYSLASNPRSKPPLSISGDVGSGKTRTTKGVAELYGLPFIASKVEENGEDDFWPGLDAGGLFTLDNADTRTRWLADALAAAATDGCSQRRKLYTDAEQITLRARAWLCVTSANPSFAADAGLADRLLVVRLGRREGTTSDAALSDEIAAARDAGLSHIAATLSKALADSAPTPEGLNARHPDFAAFAVKIGRALGREAEAIAALRAAEADKSAFCLENDTIGAALLAYVHNAGEFSGTAAKLAECLQEVDPDLKDRLSAKRLGKRLSALWPHLVKALPVAKKETDRKGFTVFAFKAAPSAECAEFQTAIS